MGCAWFRHQGLLLFTCTVITNFFSVVNAGCAAGPSILTTEGCTACEDYSLCRGFVQASDCVGPNCKTDGNCTFECMSVNANSATLAVLVEFGDYQSEEEVAAGTYNDTELSEYPDETSNWPSVSNNQVDTLGAIDLSSAVATFIVSGGSSVSKYPKGKTEVTKVVLQNLDLGMQFNLLPDYLPSSVETLDLSNTLLSEFPTEFNDMSSLQRLLLDYNYLTTVSANDVIDSITTLSLDNNNIDTFNGVFPELEY
ncbi:TKL protein kinase, partial [Phytophthora palmivora]